MWSDVSPLTVSVTGTSVVSVEEGFGVYSQGPVTITGSGTLSFQGSYMAGEFGGLTISGANVEAFGPVVLIDEDWEPCDVLIESGSLYVTSGDEYAIAAANVIIGENAAPTAVFTGEDGTLFLIDDEESVATVVKNAVAGTGWTDAEGTEGETAIDVSAEGQTISTDLKKVQFTAEPAHTHDFTFSADGATVTATCGAEGCDLTGDPTLTLAAPTLTTYGQSGEGISEKATLTGLTDFNTATGKSIAATDIKYYKATKSGTTYTKGDALASAPTDAGDYLAEITLSGVKTSEGDDKSVTASVGYTIAPITISSVTVTDITAPAATEALDTAATTSTANVTLGTVTWNPTTTPAAYAT